MGCSSRGRKESDTTERLSATHSLGRYPINCCCVNRPEKKKNKNAEEFQDSEVTGRQWISHLSGKSFSGWKTKLKREKTTTPKRP